MKPGIPWKWLSQNGGKASLRRRIYARVQDLRNAFEGNYVQNNLGSLALVIELAIQYPKWIQIQMHHIS